MTRRIAKRGLASLFALLIPVQIAWAEPRDARVLHKEDRVRTIQLQEDGKAFDVAFWGLAAIYSVPKSRKEVVRCLSESARRSREAKIELQPRSGEVVGCKLLPPKPASP